MSNYLLVEGESYLAPYLTKQRKIFKVPRHLREEIESLCAYIALFNQNPMSVGYSGRPGESGFPGGCGEYPVGCVISLMCENS